jgi:hypothetical protein
MDRDWAIEAVKKPYVMEDPKIIDLCLKRLAITREQFDEWVALPSKTFRDYNTGYNTMLWLRPAIKLATKMGFMPEIVYDKYFLCGE